MGYLVAKLSLELPKDSRVVFYVTFLRGRAAGRPWPGRVLFCSAGWGHWHSRGSFNSPAFVFFSRSLGCWTSRHKCGLRGRGCLAAKRECLRCSFCGVFNFQMMGLGRELFVRLIILDLGDGLAAKYELLWFSKITFDEQWKYKIGASY